MYVEKRNISDAEIRRRKKLQGHISQATGALGLAALGGTLAASRPGRRALRSIPKLRPHIAPPKAPAPDRDRIAGATTPVLATSAGLGGIGSFNFASYTGAEAKKRKPTTPVAKNLDLDMGYFGDEGQALTWEEIEKVWEPVSSKFDAETRRHSRNKKQQAGLGALSAGLGGAAIGTGVHAARIEGQNRTPGQLKARHLPKVKAAQAARTARALKTGKVAAGLAAGSAAAGIGTGLVGRQRKGSWKSYRD